MTLAAMVKTLRPRTGRRINGTELVPGRPVEGGRLLREQIDTPERSPVAIH
jgi:hypothetical protein